MVGADEGDHAAFDHRDGVPAVQDVFADQRAGGLVVFGDSSTVAVEDGVDRDRGGRGEGAARGGLAPTLRLVAQVDQD